MQKVQYLMLVVVVLADGHFHKPVEEVISELLLRLEGAADAAERIEQQEALLLPTQHAAHRQSDLFQQSAIDGRVGLHEFAAAAEEQRHRQLRFLALPALLHQPVHCQLSATQEVRLQQQVPKLLLVLPV
jgi:hypothetical protein